MRVKINVTEAEIEKGIPGRMNACPIYYAVRPLIKNKYKVTVDGYALGIETRLQHADALWTYEFAELPAKASNFICNFDEKKTRHKAKPFSFCVNISEELLKETK